MYESKPLLKPSEKMIFLPFWKKNMAYSTPAIISDNTRIGEIQPNTSEDSFSAYLFVEGIKLLGNSDLRTYVRDLKIAEIKHWLQKNESSAIIFLEESLQNVLNPINYHSVLKSERFEEQYVLLRNRKVKRVFVYIPPKNREQAGR